MDFALIPPAGGSFWFIPAWIVYTLIPVVGITSFLYIIVMRLKPMVLAAPDRSWREFLGETPQRIYQVLKIWLLQYRHPRYMSAGVMHILLFSGFLLLGLRSTELMFVGIKSGFHFLGPDGFIGAFYNIVRAYAATWVLAVALFAIYRRVVTKPARYAVPAKYGKDHTAEAVFVLCLISTLVLAEGLFEGSLVAAQKQQGMEAHTLAPLTLAWIFQHMLAAASKGVLQSVHSAAYFVHDVTFFFFLCFLPFGKHFHVVTSVFNVGLMRIRRGNVKPVQYGVSDAQLDDLDSFGVKKLEDFTWRHILHFYSCVDCGRCSDNCPANAAGRPLSPRFISIKGRNLVFAKYPVWGAPKVNGDAPMIGTTYEEDEIWSCTTCGACEQECPVGIEYIDKIVDMRRGMVDEGMVPQSLQKPLKALEKRGNPWGKMEKKRAEWTKALAENGIAVKELNGGDQAEVLYFVDSITSFDDRMQAIGQATAKLIHATGTDFGILGKAEKDSGHEVRRFGEEMLFQDLKNENSDNIKETGASKIVVSDPHTYNALKNDYEGLPPVEHISQFLLQHVKKGTLQLKASGNGNGEKIYTYHDPCYLGRHSGVYEDPRQLLDAIPGLKRVDMLRCRDRSFCCGGGGLMLFYEPEEEQRMGVLRVKMAEEAGANVIVTACPFCLVNMEDAIKVAGLEGKMEAIDLAELVAAHTDA
ncbi:MAG: (Fe-S)-binding protein [Desulfatitalea sp.]|nr:(Fe-S)-binding protein [Desulfatitalea sp.]NNK00003.1 (Fe-S)-binding protein [Desulfatitalea sp.]